MDRPVADTAPAGRAAPDAQGFVAAIKRLIGGEAAGRDHFLLAVSGGPDSMAMLALATDACPGRIAVATVDHQLRADSAREAAMVADRCQAIGVPHATLRPETPIAGSVQAAARFARYALLESERQRTGCDWLLTAHHADDQLETMLMRANRGSGVGGMAGIRARNGHVLRPLLGYRRDALAGVVAGKGWPVVDDPSNRDNRFDRARLRGLLADGTLGDALNPPGFAATAAALDEADAALEWVTDRLAQDHFATGEGAVLIDVAGLPPELVRRLLTRALTGCGEQPRGEALTRAMTFLSGGGATMLGRLRLSPAPDGRIAIRPAPPRRTGPA